MPNLFWLLGVDYTKKAIAIIFILFISVGLFDCCSKLSNNDTNNDITTQIVDLSEYAAVNNESVVDSEHNKIDNGINDSNYVKVTEKVTFVSSILNNEDNNKSITYKQYSNEAYTIINDNIPFFNSSDLSAESFESYSSLDSLGRCGVAYANIGTDIMPTEERGQIGSVKPSGWHTVKYDCVDGKYLYNRCHLIGYQLSAENANDKNLITGTRYLNIKGMLPFENMVADYIKETDNHVLYRVTPVFKGDNLLCEGVQIEAFSVEDDGDGICFNVFCYNVQPGICIDYSSGDSYEIVTLTTEKVEKTTKKAVVSTKKETTKKVTQKSVEKVDGSPKTSQMVLITRTGECYHRQKCGNGTYFEVTLDEAKSRGLRPCSKCY